MKIIDPVMANKMDKALRLDNNLYNLDDIENGLRAGDMQGHVEGDTWAITQIHLWPRKKAVHILYVVGSLENSIKLEAKIEAWAKEMGADLVTAIGREAWWHLRTPGWKKTGVLYSKDIT